MPIQTAIDSISNSQGSPFGFKNRIINGAMVIDQRNAGASITPSGSYLVDRWIYQNSQTSKVTAQQNQNSVTPPAGFTYYSGFTSSSAYTLLAGDYFLYRQFIEGYNIADLAWGTANAATVTLSFWVRSSLTGTFGGALNNSAQNRSYPFTYTISVANTFEYKTVTIAGDTTGTWLTTNGIGITVGFSLGTGSTFSGAAGSWSGNQYFGATGATSVVGTNGATFYITGVQVEKGTQATSFDYRPYGTELQLCQRYCMAWRATASTQQYFFTGQAYNTSTALYTLPLPVTPRVPPTGLTVSSAADWGTLTSGGGGTTGSAFTINSPSAASLSAQITITTASLVAGNATTLYSQPAATNAYIYTTGSEL
jgi:hypothetical protein